MRRLLCLVGLLTVLVQRGKSEIASSSDLNCDFSSSCRWRNGTNGVEDGAEFVAGQNLEMDQFHRITAIRPDEDDFFVYTSALGGRQEAVLVSDVINCQLGGANIKYWYWKTGIDVNLDICVRQPPGNRDRSTYKCYDGLSATFAQQWIFRAIELPPISQPFELIFRATFTAPLDILALDNIVYDAILCDGGESPEGGQRRRRRTRSTALQVLGLNEWRAMQAQLVHEDRKQVMLIVGDNVPEPAETTTTTTATTTTTEITTTPTTPDPSTSPTFPTLLTESFPSSTTTTALSTEFTTPPDHMDNAVKFLHQIQPVLPYIPTLVRTLQSIDPRVAQATGTDPFVELNEISKIVGIDLVETASEIRRAMPSSSTYAPYDKRYDGVLRNRIEGVPTLGTTPSPVNSQASPNIFGLERAAKSPTFIAPTVYPPRLVKSLKTTVQRAAAEEDPAEETMDLSHLSTEELKQLEHFHNKIFKKSRTTIPTRSMEETTPATPQLVVFKKQRVEDTTHVEEEIDTPSLEGSNSVSELLMEHMDDLKSILPPEALKDLSKLREIPRLDELTRGMDVSLINKPGGFAALKKEFMQRMIRRSLGLPPEGDSPRKEKRHRPLPPPIVPIKVTRTMFRQAMRALS